MRLFEIKIPSQKLLSIPKEERLFFIQMTNLADELFALQKLTFFSASTEESFDLIRRAQNSQALFLMRLTAGKLWEGWRLLETHFFASKLSEEYSRHLSEQGNKYLDCLKKYFSNSNLIKIIRDEYAFHVSKESSERIDGLIEQANDEEVFSLFFSEHHGNCFYEMSDTLLNISLFKMLGYDETGDAIKKTLTEISEVLNNYLCFVGECVLVFGYNHLGLETSEVEIPSPPDINKVSIPYFVSKNK